MDRAEAKHGFRYRRWCADAASSQLGPSLMQYYCLCRTAFIPSQ